jgi:hypothetical protein
MQLGPGGTPGPFISPAANAGLFMPMCMRALKISTIEPHLTQE